MPAIVHVEARAKHRLFVRFDDGVEGEVNMADRLFGPLFEPLKQPQLFAQVTLDEFGAPCWPNGADVAPDGLYAAVSKAVAPAPVRTKQRRSR